jgi:hypothetical protein
VAAILRRFTRNADAEEKAKCNQLKTAAARLEFKQNWSAAMSKITSGRTIAKSTTSKSKTEYKKGLYVNFANMIKAEGGEIDIASATRTATLKANKYIKRGAPWVGYDADGEQLLFLNISRGINTSNKHNSELTEIGEFEMDPELAGAALSEAASLGLRSEIPLVALAGFSTPPSSHRSNSFASDSENADMLAAFEFDMSQGVPHTAVVVPPPERIMITPSPLVREHGPTPSPLPRAVGLHIKVERDETMPMSDGENDAGGKPSKKNKTRDELDFNEVQALGKKLLGLQQKTDQIIEFISVGDEPPWAWASHDLPTLKLVNHACVLCLLPFKNEVNMKALQQWQKHRSQYVPLPTLKNSLLQSIKDVEMTITPLIRQHHSRNLEVKSSVEPKTGGGKPKKAKAA